MRNTEKAITLKLGGSEATSAEGANYEYLYSFIDQIANTLNTFDKIELIIGGGPRIRVLQKTVDTDYEKDMIAREAMWGHAETLSEVASNLGFEKIAVARSLDEAIALANDDETRVITMSWLKSGQSSDASSILLAREWWNQEYETFIVILSNVLNIFTADPKKNDNTRAIASSSIDNLVTEGVILNNPDQFVPGMNVPIDPVAISLLQQLGSSAPDVFFGSGNDTEGVLSFLKGRKPETGTVLSTRNKVTAYVDRK